MTHGPSGPSPSGPCRVGSGLAHGARRTESSSGSADVVRPQWCPDTGRGDQGDHQRGPKARVATSAPAPHRDCRSRRRRPPPGDRWRGPLLRRPPRGPGLPPARDRGVGPPRHGLARGSPRGSVEGASHFRGPGSAASRARWRSPPVRRSELPSSPAVTVRPRAPAAPPSRCLRPSQGARGAGSRRRPPWPDPVSASRAGAAVPHAGTCPARTCARSRSRRPARAGRSRGPRFRAGSSRPPRT